ncbi:MAG TPA: response regulator [Candidatus Solibacter sp.]|nr:response regulator [Candidatus Solibacter sp.]
MANGINVLIVDDISTTLDNLRKLLAFEPDIDVVGTAGTGREAIEQTKLLHPDVVLMDVNMPEMDGIQATEILASEAPDSPVIIMSVQGERDYLRRAMQSGAREFLIKPFSGDELIASVRRVHQLEQRKETYSRAAAGPPGSATPPAPAEAPPAPDVAAPELPVAQPPSPEAVVETAAETAPAEAPDAAPTGPEPSDEQPTEEQPTDVEAPPEAEPAAYGAGEFDASTQVEPAATPDEAVEAGAELSPATDGAAPITAPEAPAAEPVAEISPAEPAGGAAQLAPGGVEPGAPEPSPTAAAQTYGELVVFYGGKGGVGTSVLAANLACALAREAGARVALVDLDLQFGDVGVLLNLPQTQSISDLVAAIDQMDADFVSDVMADGPAGIRVLPAATSPELADLVAPEHVQKILELLRRMFDFVVVDTSSNLGDVTLTALDMASNVILVTAPSITSVKNAKLALRLLESISIPTGAVTLVLNRSEAHTEFNKDSIESHLKFPITIQVPHDPRTIVNSINRGVPFVINNPEVEASQRVRQLAAHLLPDKIRTAPPPPRNRGMLFGRR